MVFRISKLINFCALWKSLRKIKILWGPLVIRPAPPSIASTACCYARRCCWPLSLASTLATALPSRLRCCCPAGRHCSASTLALLLPLQAAAALPHACSAPAAVCRCCSASRLALLLHPLATAAHARCPRCRGLTNQLAAGRAPTSVASTKPSYAVVDASKLEPPPSSSSLTPQLVDAAISRCPSDGLALSFFLCCSHCDG
jgi:hypothetical protein